MVLKNGTAQFSFWAKRGLSGVSHYWDRLRHVRLFFWHQISSSNISRTVWPKITKFYMDNHTEIVYNRTIYDIIIYFRSEVKRKNCRKYRLQWLWAQFLENGSSEDGQILQTLSRTICLTNLPDMTSPAASGRHVLSLENPRKCRIRRLCLH